MNCGTQPEFKQLGPGLKRSNIHQMSSSTSELLDRLLQERAEKREHNRLITLQKVFTWLDQWADYYSIEKAFVFGSLICPGHFWETSDVDIAVEDIDRELHFQAISHLSRTVERNVDLIPLEHCHFADRIREGGMVWTAKPNLFS